MVAAPPQSGHGLAIAAGVLILAAGAGAALAILLSGGGSPERTITRQARAVGTLEPGHYVQAGSFQTITHADAERRRLASLGIKVDVASSDEARELYPGFQVLLGGPFRSHSAEMAMVARLRRNGVPSAFARTLTPTTASGAASAIGGRWSGTIERTDSEHPDLDGSFPVVLTISGEGQAGSLEVSTTGCRTRLALTASDGPVYAYRQSSSCIGTGPVLVRDAEHELMLTLPMPGSDAFALGTLGGD